MTEHEKAVIARRAYQREWRRKNPEKVKAQHERYFARLYDKAIRQMKEGDQA